MKVPAFALRPEWPAFNGYKSVAKLASEAGNWGLWTGVLLFAALLAILAFATYVVHQTNAKEVEAEAKWGKFMWFKFRVGSGSGPSEQESGGEKDLAAGDDPPRW